MTPHSAMHRLAMKCPSNPVVRACLLISFVLMTVSADGAEWQPDVAISNFPMWSLTGPAIATGRDSRTHIAWSEQIGEDMGDQVFYRSGNGLSWNPAVQLSQSYMTSHPAIVVDRAGRVHVAWSDWDDGQDGIFYRRFEAGSWTPEVRMNNYDGRRAGHPRLAADPDGTVHLVWEQGESYPPPAFSEIYYSHWDGSAWTAQTPLTEGLMTAGEPAIAVAPDGVVHVVWQDDRTGVDRVYHRECAAGSWSPATPIGSSAAPTRHVDIAANTVGNVHAVMVREESSSKVCLSRLTGAGWSEPIPLTSEASDYPRIAAGSCEDEHLDFHVVWREQVSNVGVIMYMRIHGLVFSPPEQITSGGADAVHAVISTDPICNLGVAWRDNREGPFVQGVYYREGIVSAAEAYDYAFGVEPRIFCTPNPFTDRLSFRISGGAAGTLRIFDVAGRTVRVLPIERDQGTAIEWDGRSETGFELGPGVFFYRVDGETRFGHAVRVR